MNEEKIIQKLIEHDDKLSNLASQKELDTFRHEVLSQNEEMITVLKRLDQERIFTVEWVKRIEQEVAD